MDRNNREMVAAQQAFESLSARRAWIEIAASGCAPSANGGRSPQGERG